jgi:hypothetical protein
MCTNPRAHTNELCIQTMTYRPNGTQITSDPLSIRTSGILSRDLFQISDVIVEDMLFEEATELDLEDCIYCGLNFDTVLPFGPYNNTAPRNFMSPVASNHRWTSG